MEHRRRKTAIGALVVGGILCGPAQAQTWMSLIDLTLTQTPFVENQIEHDIDLETLEYETNPTRVSGWTRIIQEDRAPVYSKLTVYCDARAAIFERRGYPSVLEAITSDHYLESLHIVVCVVDPAVHR